MNCWKSINLNKQYGNHKIVILSLLTMLLSFIIIYTFISTGIASDRLNDNHIVFFLLIIFFMYPIHKILHLLPLLFVKSKIKILNKPFMYLPIITIKIVEPISKWLFIVTLLTPFIVVSTFVLLCTLMFPSYAHYLTILLSLHIGLCVSDLITLKNIFFSPPRCLIEEFEDDIQLLVRKS
ncbi:DUF3267 domain-containing protein [Bacillus massiliigorillae]|uniref:DUF3267 domain-containing protein n=1 Tax=Bacillus massiliigorillae TaxID=1243664 RepID=UPI0003A77B6B|nr:DUF3267 domain-containing protein [Bacillus massiliigorillae]